VHRVKVATGGFRENEEGRRLDRLAERQGLRQHHTGTHLLHAALRRILGTHVTQAGSLVAPDHLRFDFSHGAQVKDREIEQVEELVNEHVQANTPVTNAEMDLDAALAAGAMALFGEKYGDRRARGEDRRFFRPSSAAARTWTRRVRSASSRWPKRARSLGRAPHRGRRGHGGGGSRRAARACAARGGRHPQGRRRGGAAAAAQAARRAEDARGASSPRWRPGSRRGRADDLVASARQVNGIAVVAGRIDGLDPDGLRAVADTLRDRLGSGVVCVGSVVDGKVNLVAAVTKDLVKRFPPAS